MATFSLADGTSDELPTSFTDATFGVRLLPIRVGRLTLGHGELQLGLGAAAAYGMVSMPMAPARVGAQDTGAADVVYRRGLTAGNRTG